MRWWISLTVLIVIAPVNAAEPVPREVRLGAMTHGLADRLGFFIPQHIELSAQQPMTLKKLPPKLVWPLYGVLPVGNSDTRGRVFHVILDSDGPDSRRARLYVDTRGDGDLSSAPAVEWAVKTTAGKDGAIFTGYTGGAVIDLGDRANPFLARLGMYATDPRDPGASEFRRTLFYYADYARAGPMPFGEHSYDVLLIDRYTTGDFSNQTLPPGKNGDDSPIRLYIDRNGSGKFGATEKYEAGKPFAIDGVTYTLADISPSGDRLRLRPSTQAVRELPAPPDYAVGKPILPFVANTIDGHVVHFPMDYKGKIVALDLWATWCGPCMEDEPRLVAAYQSLHARGLEVLGVSLDAAADRPKLLDITRQLGMNWPEIFDGKQWQGEIVEKYGIGSIPAMFLVDGDTGLILAQGDDLQGEQMRATIEKAMSPKTSHP